MNELGSRLGENMIACVDSDYDYLLQGRTQTSRYIINSPYVLQTYAYAIENYHCYAEGLHEACVTATLNDHKLIDFPAFMKLYSEIAYPLSSGLYGFTANIIYQNFPYWISALS